LINFSIGFFSLLACSLVQETTGVCQSPGRPLGVELDGPDDPARARRLDWADLFKHTARRILDHLGLPSRAPPRRQPWRPGQQVIELADCPIDRDGIDPPFIAD
jgi:hypothetical protein